MARWPKLNSRVLRAVASHILQPRHCPATTAPPLSLTVTVSSHSLGPLACSPPLKMVRAPRSLVVARRELTSDPLCCRSVLLRASTLPCSATTVSLASEDRSGSCRLSAHADSLARAPSRTHRPHHGQGRQRAFGSAHEVTEHDSRAALPRCSSKATARRSRRATRARSRSSSRR